MQLNKAIQNRWSPRGFTSEPVTREMIELLFEAARLAPSSRNEQPWNYYYVHRENTKVFSEFLELLTGNNPLWAKNAQVLIISVLSKTSSYNNLPNGKALHDIGAASVSMAIQAAEMGIQIHQMGGFDKQKTTEYLQLAPNLLEPVTMIAVGFPREDAFPSEDEIARKVQHQVRKKLNEFVFEVK